MKDTRLYDYLTIWTLTDQLSSPRGIKQYNNGFKKQEDRAVARKPRDARGYSFRFKARLQSSKHTGAKQNLTQWPFKVIEGRVFWGQWKGDKGLSNTSLQ